MTTTSYTVHGLTCGHCVSSVRAELGRLPGVVSVEVDLGSGQVVVQTDQVLDDGAVRAAVDEAGYELAR